MVQGSPHVFDDISISFTKHNEGINWRRAQLNRECSIRLVGPPLDNWSTDDVNAIVNGFSRVLASENDEFNLGRILVTSKVFFKFWIKKNCFICID
jgi:hypothetical protein